MRAPAELWQSLQLNAKEQEIPSVSNTLIMTRLQHVPVKMNGWR
jgi:hypothetical protein